MKDMYEALWFTQWSDGFEETFSVAVFEDAATSYRWFEREVDKIKGASTFGREVRSADGYFRWIDTDDDMHVIWLDTVKLITEEDLNG
jgi:hypothetical protein